MVQTLIFFEKAGQLSAAVKLSKKENRTFKALRVVMAFSACKKLWGSENGGREEAKFR